MQLVPNSRPSNQIEVVKKAEENIEYKMVGSMRVRPGLTLFYYDPKDGLIHTPELERKDSINIDTKKLNKKSRTQFVDGAIYFWALNRRTAAKKVDKLKKKGVIE